MFSRFPYLFLSKNKIKQQDAYYFRPDQVNPLIDGSFDKIQQSESSEDHGYVFTGGKNYSFYVSSVRLSSDKILSARTKVISEEDPPLVVLDIGGGDFSFASFNDNKYKGSVVTYSVGANDYLRLANNVEQSDRQVLANAEYLDKIFENNSFDFIFSKLCFIHFVDPIGSLVQAYDALKIGGVLLIDKFSLPGLEAYSAHIIAFLEQQGYRIIAGSEYGQINNFVIQKTADKPRLKLPVLFDKIVNEEVFYKPTTQLSKFFLSHPNLNQEAYEKGKKLFFENINESEIEIINQYQDLLSLLADPEYSMLSTESQYRCILGFVVKNVSFDSYEDIVADCIRVDDQSKFKGQFLYLLESMKLERHSILNTLSNQPQFNAYQYDPIFNYAQVSEQQIRIIILTAIHDLIRISKREDVVNQLKKMNISFSLEDIEPLGDLSFSNVVKGFQSQLLNKK